MTVNDQVAVIEWLWTTDRNGSVTVSQSQIHFRLIFEAVSWSLKFYKISTLNLT